MLRSLSGARLGVILFPREARLFPLIEDVVHEVFPESGVDFCGLGFVGARLGSDVLDFCKEWEKLKGLKGEFCIITYIEAFHGEVVHVHPYRTSPVVLVCLVEFVALAQTSDSVFTPELLRIVDQVQYCL